MLYCYGENSFTFLAFQALHSRGELRRTLIPNLKQMGTGRLFREAVGEGEQDELWLFPNFGKMYGFGEPDALLLIGHHSFWFEVETCIDLGRNIPGTEASLLQLLRFHYLHDALKRGAKPHRIGSAARHLRIIGPTVSNSGRCKLAGLRVKGHPVLQKIRQRLAQSRPHFVLMAQSKAKGAGGGERFAVALGKLLEQSIHCATSRLVAWSDSTGVSRAELPAVPQRSAFWYVYWEGDLKSKLSAESSAFLQGCRYISRRR